MFRFWIRQLEEKQPEFAQQIHIFNSFFYKKLNSNNERLVAYPSSYHIVILFSIVMLRLSKQFANGHRNLIFFRRNMSSFPSTNSKSNDYCVKLLLTLPSMHWYLAIIYEPEHVLSATAPTQKYTLPSAEADLEEIDLNGAQNKPVSVSSQKSP
jgi:Ulp1 family protease